MSNSKIWLSAPHMSGEEQKYLRDAFVENWITLGGTNVVGLEADLERYLDNSVSVAALSSGTAALHLALLLLGVQAGDEVICQSLTFVASANPIAYLNAIPVFVDSEDKTWNMCPSALEEALKDRLNRGKNVKAVVAVHLNGMPFNAEEIYKVCKKYNVPLVEDSAAALGSYYKDRKCGTWGDIAIFSFNGNKIITTSAGGAMVVKNPQMKEKVVFLATQAKDKAPYYQHSQIGYNYRMSNICAGIGRGQMEVLENFVDLRRKVNEWYVDYFKNCRGVKLLREPNEDYYSNHWLSAVLIDPELCDGKNREGLRFALEEANIESRPLWKPMHLQPVFANSPYYGERVSETLFENGLCLPSGSNMTEEDKRRIKLVFDDFFEK